MDDSAKHSLLLVADRRGGPRFLHQCLSNSVRPVLLSTGIRSGLSPSCYKCHFIMAGRPQSIWNFNAARAQHRRATQRISWAQPGALFLAFKDTATPAWRNAGVARGIKSFECSRVCILFHFSTVEQALHVQERLTNKAGSVIKPPAAFSAWFTTIFGSVSALALQASRYSLKICYFQQKILKTFMWFSKANAGL